MEEERSGMNVEEFRRAAYSVVDLICDYQSSVHEKPVRPSVQPGDIRAALPPHPPMHGEPWKDIEDDVKNIIMKGDQLFVFVVHCSSKQSKTKKKAFQDVAVCILTRFTTGLVNWNHPRF